MLQLFMIKKVFLIYKRVTLMGSAAQGICNKAYFEYVEAAIPRRTQPIGKWGHLEIKN